MATSSTSQAKITQKLVARTAFFLFVLAALFFGYRYMQEQHGDFNRGAGDTLGMISAVQVKNDGTEAVIIKSDGTIKGTKSWHESAEDREPIWRPDGKFLFFTSNRVGDTFDVYRWNPDESDAEIRTVGKRGRSNPTFPVDGNPETDENPLIVSGGNVQSLDPKRMITPQVLPPPQATITENSEEQAGGSEALFSSLYGNLGTSFRYARWCKGNAYIAAIMLRDSGEVLVLQSMTPKDGKLPHPIPVVAGDHVEFDVNPKDGSIVYCAQNFKWPDPSQAPAKFRTEHAVTVPFRHVVGVADPDKTEPIIVAANLKDDHAFEFPSISPDGSTLLFVEGPYDGSSHITPKHLLTMPLKAGGIQSSSPLVEGEVYEPAWSPDGSKIAFAMRANGKRDIFTIGKDGSSQTNLTKGVADFRAPRFSPQIKTQ